MKRLTALLVALLLCLSPAYAIDISNSGYSETDSSNTTASPDGWPTGITGAGAVNTGRMMMGSLKRFWDRINGTVTSGGSANAYTYTPTNASFPTAITAGEIFSFKANFTNTGASTLAVNGLTAKNIFKQTTGGPVALTGGEIVSGQLVMLAYDGTQYQLLSQAATAGSGLVLISTLTASASNTIAFTGLSSIYDHYEVRFTAAVPTTNADNLAVQFGTGASPTWSTGGSYVAGRTAIRSDNTTVTGNGGANGIIIIGSASSSASGAINGRILIPGPSNGAQDHQLLAEVSGFASDSNYYRVSAGGAWTADQTAITAVRIFFTSSAAGALSADTIASGTFSLYGVAK